MKKTILFFLLFIIVCPSFFANNRHKTEPGHYKIRRISPENGLGTNGQRDVQQDKRGFIWIITVNNLYRFDGYTFKYYTDKLKKPDSSTPWSFERLEVDKNGDIYVTSNYGLLKYNPLTDNFDYLLQGRVNLVKEDTKGRLWMSNPYSVGLFDRNSLEFGPVESDEGIIRPVSVICAKDKSVYVGTGTGEIYVYEEDKGLFRNVFHKPQHNIVDITHTDSLLYMLTENRGLTVISREDYKEVKYYDFFYPDADTRVSARALFIDQSGYIWITSQRGIYILNPETDEYAHYYYDKTDPYGLPSSSVWRISEDNQGNLWLGTYSGGLCFINLDEQKKFKSFNGLTDDLSYTVVSSFEEDENYVWIGTEGGGLNRYDKRNNRFTHFKHNPAKNSLSYDNIQSLLFTGKNNLWIGMSRGGLDHLNTQTGKFSHFSVNNNMLMNDHVERIVAEADSGIWIKYLMDREYLTYFSTKENKPEHFNFLAPPIQANGNISDIQRGNGDTLWVASSNQLQIMNVRTREVSFAPYKHTELNDTNSLNILTILADNKNHVIWIGTNGNGLLMYDVSSQSLHRKADLSKYNAYLINSINKDDNDNLWLGTNNGLFCLDIESDRLQQYGKSDGAQGQTYYPFSTFRSNTGKLYFGGNEGFTIIDPVANTYNEYKPDIIISDFLLDNTPVIPGVEKSPLSTSIFQARELILKHNQNNFSFEFTSTNYLNPDKNRFKYCLKGYDERWIETDATHRSASYAKVPRGKYTFEIMTANNDGIWGNPTSILLIVKPAPWFSNGAITGYILLFLLILFVIIRHYNHQRKLKMQFYLEEQDKKRKEAYHQEQLQFFTNVSHDFRTPLSLILAALEPVKAGNPAKKYLSVLENNARRLLALVNELMDFRSLQNKKIKLHLQENDWNEFVSSNCTDFSGYAGQKEIRFITNTDGSVPEKLYFDAKVMEKILLNLLNNAFKYTREGGIISVSTLADIRNFKSPYTGHIIIEPDNNTKEMFGLVISDNGIGISGSSIGLIFERYYRINESTGTQHMGSGIGLALVKSLVELHKGYIAIYSERGKGSDFVIGFPATLSAYKEEDFTEDEVGIRLSDTWAVHQHDHKDNAEESPIYPPGQSEKKILIVEDNDDLRELLAGFLGRYYDVKEVANGLEALKYIRKEDADLIITDVMMPGMDGTELSKTIKNNIETSHIPVVMLTAKTGTDNQIEGLHSGADIYLEKPVDKQILLLTISNLFKQQVRIKEYYAKHYFAQTNANETHVNKRDAEFMKRLIDLIENNLSNTDIDVFQVASSLAMSRRTLYGKVKAMTGQSVVEFIRNYRLRKAAQILAGTDIPISDVMERVGIDNASYFSRIFKKEFGESPSDFASRHHEKQ